MTIRLPVLAAGAIGLACLVGGAVSGARAGEGCIYQGAMYSDGAFTCQAGVRFKCDDGDWKSKKERCTSERVVERRDTTTYSGMVSEVDPSSSTIILRSESSEAPRRYTFTKKTTFIDEAGDSVTYETIRNRPVTVYYEKDGDRLVVNRVIVTGPSAGVIQRKETTEERETD
jgi:hypothetical protein